MLKLSQEIVTKCLPSYKTKHLVIHLETGEQTGKASIIVLTAGQAGLAKVT